MNDRRLEILDWPEQLHCGLDHLERTTHQEFIEAQMDDGSVRRRPATSPMPAFKGNVLLSPAERTALDEFYAAVEGCHFSFKDPRTGETVYATFMQAPFNREMRDITGTDPTYLVEIALKDTTTLVKAALKHGVVSHD